MEGNVSLDETLTSGSKFVNRSRDGRALERSLASHMKTQTPKTSTSPLNDDECVGNIDIVPSVRSPTFLGSGDTSSSLNLSDVVQQSCQECKNNDAEQICLDCNTVSCNICIYNHSEQTNHFQTMPISNQSNILTIPGTLQYSYETMSTDDAFVDCKSEKSIITAQLNDSLFQLRRFRLENNEENLKAQLNNLVKEVDKHTEELLKLIKLKQKQFVEDINGMFKPIFDIIRLCDEKIENVLLDIESVEKPKRPDEQVDQEEQHKTLKEIKARNVKEYRDFETKRQALRPVSGLTFTGNSELQSLLKRTKFGEIVRENSKHNGVKGNSSQSGSGLNITTNRLQITTRNIHEKHGANNLNVNYECSNETRITNYSTLKSYSCWTEGDYGSKTCITDLVKTKQDTILIADNGNKKLKLVRINGDEFDVCDSIDLGGEPWQIAPYLDNKYIVTVLKGAAHAEPNRANDEDNLSEPTCVLVDTLGFLSIERSFGLKKESTGAAVAGNNFIFCGYNGDTAHIFETDSYGNCLSMNTYCGKTRLRRPNYLCVSEDGLLLYVSDADKGILGLRTDNLGEIIFCFEGKPKMRCPLGTTVCCNGDLLICASQSKEIFRMSKDGKQKKSYRVGLRGLQSVCKISNSLAVVSSDEAGYEFYVLPLKGFEGGTL